MKNFLLLIILSISLMISGSSFAGHWHNGGWGHHHGGWGGNNFVGAAAGLAAFSILVNQANRGYYQDPYYYRPYYYPYNQGYYYYSRCRLVGGYYDYYGYWIPRH